MIFSLIAESKTMSECLRSITPEEFVAHRPVFENVADAIMEGLRDMSASEIAEAVGISDSLAARACAMIYEFPNKLSGEEAITAYTGVVFKAFDYGSLSVSDREWAADKIGIVSSLYGLLRPSDFVKPYRLDFTTRLAPGGRPFYSYWRDRLTDYLLENIHAGSISTILDLMPADAAKCFDWKRITQVAKVWKVDFKEMTEGGALRTPRANRLKTLRGLLLRYIVSHRIESVDQLLSIESDEFMPDRDADLPDSTIRLLV